MALNCVSITSELITVASGGFNANVNTSIGAFALGKYIYGIKVQHRNSSSFIEANTGRRSDILFSQSIGVEPSSSNRQGSFNYLGFDAQVIKFPLSPPRVRGTLSTSIGAFIYLPQANAGAGSESLWFIYDIYFSDSPDEHLDPISMAILAAL